MCINMLLKFLEGRIEPEAFCNTPTSFALLAKLVFRFQENTGKWLCQAFEFQKQTTTRMVYLKNALIWVLETASQLMWPTPHGAVTYSWINTSHRLLEAFVSHTNENQTCFTNFHSPTVRAVPELIYFKIPIVTRMNHILIAPLIQHICLKCIFDSVIHSYIP